ncbi:hypothetical protein C0Z01_02880 [Photobacterium kishitanii]|uniref:Uncharacterized protein n=2 Tax=Photobacterium kishitanii TaxID=318456 RepID=A0A2T3KBY3_9GAMM|nr:hypothetical protein [Photobacterium kishitanii]OBU23823.1 hypothetical protein AYY22_05635 [Photobacterium kishitanii]PSU91800.1 hypothetical protein C0W42_03845 [Photobacterium kishitanii]PSU92513.1 hypothetical protein C9J27_22245 [Photobacterium kishitanii]PSU93033.1 hypothetical protein C0W35_13500 [Photobacterium kishitanii]PSV20304.1 hypothetical protein C0W28_09275 [Photobacterium kishitanii]
MLLIGCSNHIEPARVEIITMLPEPWLITACNKPKIIGRTPAQTIAEDLPRLKNALSNCAKQVDDYLQWYEKQKLKTKNN